MNRISNTQIQEKTSFGDLSRSDLMARIRSVGNLTTEMRMVKLLKSAGLKGWRRHLPILGKPDFTWPKKKLLLFVDGCFWHGHNCNRNLTPMTNKEMWKRKVTRNKQRDRRVTHLLGMKGWKVLRIWECELRKHPKQVVNMIAEFLK